MSIQVNTGSQYYRCIRPDNNSWASVTALHTPLKDNSEDTENHQPPEPKDEIVNMTTIFPQNELNNSVDF